MRNALGEISAEISGRFRFELQSAADLPCVGDWVGVQWPVSGGPAIIHDVLPRRTFLRRKCPGRSVDYQMIAANIDAAFIVQGCTVDFNVHRLERYLVMTHAGGIESLVVLSKTDLMPREELDRRIDAIRSAGIAASVLPLSNATGDGLDAIRERLVPARTYCLLGSSGVGKSTLINRLMEREEFATKDVSATGEGVHTTARRQLRLLEGGAMLIDTPGMRELGLIGADEGVDATFGDVGEFAAQCRFPDCTHVHEPGCAVLAAVESGEMDEDRYRSYLKLRKETEYHDMSYIDKRRKDRAFGRFVKSALKQKKD